MTTPKIVILAGGYGTRLRPLTYTRPKPMLLLAGKPVLQHIIESLSKQGFNDFVITANYLYESIEKYFENGSRFDVNIVFCRENVSLGTAGSVKNCEDHLKDTFGVIQGDNITDLDFRALFNFHQRKRALATIGLFPVDNPQEFGIAELDENDRIIRFQEKPKPEKCFSNLANTGLYVFEPDILDYIPNGQSLDFSKNLFPKFMKLKKDIFGFRTTGFWIDIGQIENFMKANRWILSRLESEEPNSVKNLPEIRGPVRLGANVTVQNGVRVVGPAIIDEGCKIGEGSLIKPSSVIGQNVEVGEKSRITNSIIYEDSFIGAYSRLHSCIIGENCKIGSGSAIGRHVVLGANCNIGDQVNIQPHTKIWPNTDIDSESTVKGLVRSYES